MEKFEDTDDLGNKHFRRGVQVPEGDVPLAYYSAPKLTPKDNVIVIDLSESISSNEAQSTAQRKIMYANQLGILEDINGNQIIADEYPVVTDKFLTDENFSLEPNMNEYTPEAALPFRHVSRFFHLDHAGLTPGTDMRPYAGDRIKVLDSVGRDHVDAEGNPRYRIYISPAVSQFQNAYPNHWAYRVHVYTDTDDLEDLYLHYHKVEINLNGQFFGYKLSHKELVNPYPFFEYEPEESVVVDPENRDKKIYSTEQIGLKERLLKLPKPSIDGYRVYAPKKAISDPRIFQLFRWRVSCSFKQNFKVDPSKAFTVNVGVIVTSRGANRKSRTPYVFYNLEKSNYNSNGITFINPINHNRPNMSKNKAAYWYVNLDKISNEDLAKFDLLIWSPMAPSFDMKPYLSKIRYFAVTLGKTFFFDTNNWSTPENAWHFTAAVDPSTGGRRNSGRHFTAKISDVKLKKRNSNGRRHILFNGLEEMGGWFIDDEEGDNEAKSLSNLKWSYPKGFCQVNTFVSEDYEPLIVGKAVEKGNPDTKIKDVVLTEWRRIDGGGNMIISCYGHLQTCNILFEYGKNNRIVSRNMGATVHQTNNTAKYRNYINSPSIEGAMKFLYNVSLLAIRGRVLNDFEEIQYSNEWTYSSPWKSSWVINCEDEVLSEAEKAEFGFVYRRTDEATPQLLWQRQLANENLRNIIDSVMTPEQASKVRGATREYAIEVTNSVEEGGAVEVSTSLSGDSIPYAWTQAFTPKFTVPLELGPHIIKEDRIIGEYESLNYSYRQYPDKKFKCRVRASYITTDDSISTKRINWKARGTAIETYLETIETPAIIEKTTKILRLPWNVRDIANPDNDAYVLGSQNPFKNVLVPDGINFLQEYQYQSSHLTGAPSQNWVHWGMHNRYSIAGNTASNSEEAGEVVQFLQDAMNKFQFFRIFALPQNTYLAVDGIFGPKTRAAILAFQQQMNARYVDGVVDAETFALIGAQILRLEGLITTSSNNYTRYYQRAWDHMSKLNISDLDNANVAPFAKRSWVKNGPSYIWESFFLTLDQPYKIVGFEFKPFSHRANSIILEAIDVRNNMTLQQRQAYDPKYARVRGPWRITDDKVVNKNIGPYFGDTLILTLGQDKPSFENSSARLIGLKNFYAIVQTGTNIIIPGRHEIVKRTREVEIEATGSFTISGSGVKSVRARVRDNRKLSNIRWIRNGVTVTPNDGSIDASINPSTGLITFRMNGIRESEPVSNSYVLCRMIGDVSFNPDVYYSMTENKRLNPAREIGTISKDDGIKLICTDEKKPYGFNATSLVPLMPTGANNNDLQRHFLTLKLDTFDLDPHVRVGFYDVRSKEFITNKRGEPEISWIEYQRRGPNNVYIGVVTNYELSTSSPLPDDDAPIIPYRWAMPVYGVYSRASSKIKLESVPSDLSKDDNWPLAIRLGHFDKFVTIRPTSQGVLTNYLKEYQGTSVHAYYSVPEARNGSWSTIYGPPFVDVVNESPDIIDLDYIRVRYPSIHLQKEPTIWQLDSDPVRPVLEVFTRNSVSDDWVKLPWTEIKDYNTSSGEIYLKTKLKENDKNLVKVNYTSARGVYYFKGTSAQDLNFNPYHNDSQSLIGKAIYIYILPSRVYDRDGNLIPASRLNRTINFTTEPNIFNPFDIDYNPLAINIGIVYISSVSDISKLNIIDARRRGGGLKDSVSVSEISRLIGDAKYYWDISHGAGLPYQKSGLIILRFPVELKETFTDQEITEAVSRNVPVGSTFRIEDLDGNPWSE